MSRQESFKYCGSLMIFLVEAFNCCPSDVGVLIGLQSVIPNRQRRFMQYFFLMNAIDSSDWDISNLRKYDS